jgi:hypothetical protein
MEKRLTRANRSKNCLVIGMGRIYVYILCELEKGLRSKTLKTFGRWKGDLAKALEKAVKTCVTKE